MSPYRTAHVSRIGDYLVKYERQPDGVWLLSEKALSGGWAKYGYRPVSCWVVDDFGSLVPL
jgi:hypothetical protein